MPLVANGAFKVFKTVLVCGRIFDRKGWSNVTAFRNGEARVRLMHQIWILLLRCYVRVCLVNS